jgi:hypothetical protein
MENTLNGVQAAVVEPTTSDATTGVSTEVKAPEAAIAKPQQSEQDNAKFAEMRRENERIAKELEAERSAKAAYAKLTETITDKLGYKGSSPEEIRLAILAEQQGKTVAEVREQETLEAAKIDAAVKSHPEYIRATREAAERRERDNKERFAKDLAEIKEIFPNETAKTVEDLGEKYIRLCADGLSPIEAYVTVNCKDIVSKLTSVTPTAPAAPVEAPPEIGAVNNAGDADGRDYFTEDEIDKLTPAQLKNPSIVEKAWNGAKKLAGKKQT